MKAGKLDRRITIQRQGAATDNGIELVDGALEDYATRWASWKPANGREVFENLGREAKSAGTFWLRYDSTTSGTLPTDKVVFDGRYWDIQSITQIDRRDGVELLVVADDETVYIAPPPVAPVAVFSTDFAEAFQ